MTVKISSVVSDKVIGKEVDMFFCTAHCKIYHYTIKLLFVLERLAYARPTVMQVSFHHPPNSKVQNGL